jgi:hypothetical protein
MLTWAELEAEDGAVVLARSGGAEQPPSSSSGVARKSAGADVMDAEVCDPLTGQPLRLPHTRGHQVHIRRDGIPKHLLLTRAAKKLDGSSPLLSERSARAAQLVEHSTATAQALRSAAQAGEAGTAAANDAEGVRGEQVAKYLARTRLNVAGLRRVS